ncbi:hypothetical protein RHGRI_004918 [Rhododendron griersonianum]|uniref:Uncharacterized protein n=1 Tax=Rhododendron griersonianum TaxID=479676 RepID=A0AAV6LBE0_9ERIC|nr:hypothetical protein RHGRI_004918 [Rhododendron griersonianum]
MPLLLSTQRSPPPPSTPTKTKTNHGADDPWTIHGGPMSDPPPRADGPLSLVEVGAYGSKSRVKELAGFKTTGWKYSQNAIIYTVEHQEDNYCAWQRFLPSGPIALFPIGDEFSNIVWTMNPKESLDRKSHAFGKDVLVGGKREGCIIREMYFV